MRQCDERFDPRKKKMATTSPPMEQRRKIQEAVS
jgi:hypothetical protein